MLRQKVLAEAAGKSRAASERFVGGGTRERPAPPATAMGRGGCAGLATMLGPPTVAYSCYITWLCGRDSWGATRPNSGSGFGANFASGVAAIGAYFFQRNVLVRPLFDEGGSLALDWKKGTESLGEPLKIKTWTQFYRAAGPPVFARTAAIVLAFYVSGAVHAWTAYKLNPAALPPPPPRKPKAEPSKKGKSKREQKE